MDRIVSFGLVLLLLGGSGTAIAREGENAGDPPERVSVLVHLERGADRGPVRRFARDEGARVRYEYRILPNVLNLRNVPERSLDRLRRTRGVVRVERDGRAHAHMNDSAPLVNALSGQVEDAGYGADGAGIRICIVDTGIDSSHSLYRDRIDAAVGYDFANDDPDPEDDNGHGSHVAGTALGGATTFDTCGEAPFQGMAPAATLIGVKVLDAGGFGSFSDIVAGIDHCALSANAQVINMSLGAGTSKGTCDNDTLAAAANAAVDNGVVVVASSGNDAEDNAVATPSCGSKVISVGATYDSDYPENCPVGQECFSFCTQANAFFCTQVCTDCSPRADDIACFSNEGSQLDVVAPGCVTFSADMRDDNAVVGFCGTSMSAPHVTGLAALLLSENPSLSPDQVRSAIRAGAVDLGGNGFDKSYGHGRIDALGSLALVTSGCQSDSECDDGNACTTDACDGGSCVHQTKSCDDGLICTEDSCDPATGECTHPSISCDDGMACTVDSCEEPTGCVHDDSECTASCSGENEACSDHADCCDPSLKCRGQPGGGGKVCR